jgi:papain fold dermonecrotoxin of polymorphic toxin system
MPDYAAKKPSASNDPTSAKKQSDSSTSEWSTEAKMIQRAKQSPASLSPRDIVQLQRTIGNHAVRQMMSASKRSSATKAISTRSAPDGSIQRDYTDNAEDFIAWIQTQKEFTSNTSNPAEKCEAAATAIWRLVNGKGMNAQYGGLLVWVDADKDDVPTNHYVVIVTVGGQEIVVDPTQAQFEGGAPMAAPRDEWVTRFKSIMKDKYVQFKVGAWTDVRSFAGIFAAGTFNNTDGDVFNQPAAQGGKKKKSKCTITTACLEARGLPDDCHELTTLRAFRDYYIQNLPQGDVLVEMYYKQSPAIVDAINRCDDALRIFHRLYRVIKRCVHLIEQEEYELAFGVYVRMVTRLKTRYAPNAMVA